MPPFIYIASLRRTGSTLLSETLTHPPHAFIFVEPGLAENGFGLSSVDERTLRDHGIDIADPVERWNFRARIRRGLGVDGDYMLRRFRDRVVPLVLERFDQVGIKEIRHRRWRRYLSHFPDMRVVLTSRDPRDIYISLHHRVRKGQGSWRGPLTPERLAEDLDREFRHQREMCETLDCLRVRYEDLCTDPGELERVKKHVECPIPGLGQVGRFLGGDPNRTSEHDLHEGRVTDKRVHRWTRETDPELRARAERMFELMPEYCRFWAYEKRP